MSINKHRLRYIENRLDSFLNTLFKEGEMVEITIKPTGNNPLEVTLKDVSREQKKNGTGPGIG